MEKMMNQINNNLTSIQITAIIVLIMCVVLALMNIIIVIQNINK